MLRIITLSVLLAMGMFIVSTTSVEAAGSDKKSAAVEKSNASKADDLKAGDNEEWIQLFNGKDLNDWVIKIKSYELGDNHGETFRVEDGLLKVSYDNYKGRFKGRFGHLFYKKPFSNYVLRVEYRIVGDQTEGAPGWAIRNSGVMIHGQTPETMDKNQDFPVSAEVQLLGGDGTNARSNANLCTPGTNVVREGKLVQDHCFSSSSETYHGDQWVTVEVEAHGNGKMIHRIDGKTVIEYSQVQLDKRDKSAQKLLKAGAEKMISGGTISLQSEGHPIEFRKVEIRLLEE